MPKLKKALTAVLATVLIGIVVVGTISGGDDVDQNRRSGDSTEGIKTNVGSAALPPTRIANTRYGFSFDTCGLAADIEGIVGTANLNTNFTYRLRYIEPDSGITYSSLTITVHDPAVLDSKESRGWYSALAEQVTYYRHRAISLRRTSELTPITIRLGEQAIDGFMYKRGINRHAEAFTQIGAYVVSVSMHGDDNHEREWLHLSCVTDSFAIDSEPGAVNVQ